MCKMGHATSGGLTILEIYILVIMVYYGSKKPANINHLVVKLHVKWLCTCQIHEILLPKVLYVIIKYRTRNKC